MPLRRYIPAALLVAVTLAGCPSGWGSPSGRIIVTAEGRVGPLRIDQSDRADVIAFAGQPESEVRGQYVSYPSFAALGYGCAGKAASDKAGVPMCETVFYLDRASGKFELLYTADPRYSNLFGIHVGTPTAVAERKLHRVVYVGCLAGLHVLTKTAFLELLFDGGRDHVVHHPSEYVHLVGGHVRVVVVHSQRRNPGVLDCVDS